MPTARPPASTSPRVLSAGPEPLEPRQVLAAAPGVFFVMDPLAGAPAPAASVAVAAGRFTLPASGSIGLRFQPATGSAPAIVWAKAGAVAAAPAGVATTGIGLVGDVNGDFRVDAADVAAISARQPPAAADVNGDGRVNAADVALARANL